jgi:hypothetical protein
LLRVSSDNSAFLSNLVVENGGKVVDALDAATVVVTPVTPKNPPPHNRMASQLWLEWCAARKALLPVEENPIFTPLPSADGVAAMRELVCRAAAQNSDSVSE